MACKRSRFFSGDTLTESEKTTAAPPVPASGTSYTWDEAVKHISETATVTGPVVNYFDQRDFGAGPDYVISSP